MQRPPWVEPGFRLEPEFEPHVPTDSTPPRRAARRPTRGRLPQTQEEAQRMSEDVQQTREGVRLTMTTAEQREQRNALRRQLRQWIEEAHAVPKTESIVDAGRLWGRVMAWAQVLDWLNSRYPDDLPPGPAHSPETAHQRHRLLYG